MSYQCRDCSYRGQKSGPSGECAACGSFNVQRGTDPTTTESPSGKKFQRAALVISWTVLLLMILHKIFFS